MGSSARSPHPSNPSPQAVVGIGGSAGSLEALLSMLGELPADLGLALVYVSHLRAETPHQALDVLNRATSLRVVPISSGEQLKPNHLYVVHPGCTVMLENGITYLQDGPAQNLRMPRATIDAGCVDEVLSPTQSARELEPIIEVLREQCGLDFSDYRASTLHRRVIGRMAITKHVHLKQYAAALRKNRYEAQALIQDILIGVTSFFRDRAAFEALAQHALPQIFSRVAHEPRKIWVAGCSSGEEAYSIAMMIEELTREQDYQIFATDLNSVALNKAVTAIYPKSIASNVSSPRLRRFFDKVPDGYRITKSLRQRCTFSMHDVLRSPPFSDVDLVSCRNLMIYLGAESRQKLLATFYHALRAKGFLFLGSSEGLIQETSFTTIDTHHRIFSKRPNAAPSVELAQSVMLHPVPQPLSEQEELLLKILREADRLQVKEYGPPAVVLNADFEILHYQGDTTPYLANYRGGPNFNLLKMCREGMVVHLRAGLRQAKRAASSIVTPQIKVYDEDQCYEIVVRVIPITVAEAPGRYYCVVFEPVTQMLPAPTRRRGGKRQNQQQVIESQRERTTQQSAEILLLREQMQQTQERQEAVQEELRAANEEIQSTNEDLMMKNRELLTAQQNLQSANEELNTFVAHIQLPIIMVWADLRIRRVTPTATRLLGACPPAIDRPISDFRSPIRKFELANLLADAISAGQSREVHALDVEDRWRQVCIHPYRGIDGHIEGAVVVLN